MNIDIPSLLFSTPPPTVIMMQRDTLMRKQRDRQLQAPRTGRHRCARSWLPHLGRLPEWLMLVWRQQARWRCQRHQRHQEHQLHQRHREQGRQQEVRQQEVRQSHQPGWPLGYRLRDQRWSRRSRSVFGALPAGLRKVWWSCSQGPWRRWLGPGLGHP